MSLMLNVIEDSNPKVLGNFAEEASYIERQVKTRD